MTYRDFIDGLQCRHFSADEVIAQGSRIRNGVRNNLPPESLWSGIVETLWIADMVRHQSGIALIITSAYRSPAYNRAVGGAARSQHTVTNTALDLIPTDGGVSRLFDALRQIRKARGFKGGLGRYASFVHLDTRGTNATWGR
jgi:uncharacterized protein YcbK (DUF882 family)